MCMFLGELVRDCCSAESIFVRARSDHKNHILLSALFYCDLFYRRQSGPKIDEV